MTQLATSELATNLLELNSLELDDIRPANTSTYFLPIRKGTGNYDPIQVAGRIVALLSQQKLKPKFSEKKLKKTALNTINGLLTNESVLPTIEAMYFNEESSTLNKISPEFLLLSAEKMSRSSRSEKLTEIFTAFLTGAMQNSMKIQAPPLDFIQEYIRQTLVHDFLDESKQSLLEQAPTEPYLPFLARAFQKDVAFLAQRPRLLLSQLPNLVSLYTFLYCSQLALNIRNWQRIPEPRPIYFILESERASLERNHIVDRGYKQLETAYKNVFPTLVILEYLNEALPSTAQHPPLWRYWEAISCYESSDELQRAIRHLYSNFATKRGLPQPSDAEANPMRLLDQLIDATNRMFQDKDNFSGQVRVNNQTFEKFRATAARPFIQQRGQLGRTLVINYDNLLLLTNLAIGNERDLSFQKLLAEFESRGIFFDRQTEPELIKIYERIGNIERMSDTGNAVKISKTL
jgi:DNA phosphorothioation-dependent restriction protein DptG